MYAVASINLDNYQDLADITDATKREYCERHGYQFFVLKEKTYSDCMGFNKIGYVATANLGANLNTSTFFI